jgi:hypothetical protein
MILEGQTISLPIGHPANPLVTTAVDECQTVLVTLAQGDTWHGRWNCKRINQQFTVELRQRGNPWGIWTIED